MSDSAPPPGSSSSTPSTDQTSSDGSPPVPSPPAPDTSQDSPPPDSSSSSPPAPPSGSPPSPPASSSPPPSSDSSPPPPSEADNPPPPPPVSDDQPPPGSDDPQSPPPPSDSSSSPPDPPPSPPSHGSHPPPPPPSDSDGSPPSHSPSPPGHSNSPPPAISPPPKNPSSPPKPSPNPKEPSPPSNTAPPPPDTPPDSNISPDPVPDPPPAFPTPPSKVTPSPPSGSRILTPVPPQSSHSSTHTGSGSSRNSSSSSSGGGTAAGITLGVLVVAMAALCFVIARKRRRRRADHLMSHYQPPPSFSVKSDGYYNSSGPMKGGSGHSYSYTAPHSGMSHGYGSQRGGGYGTPTGAGLESGTIGSARSWFTYEELMEITNGFSHEKMIGEGGFGCVYKGYLSDGKEVAVKQLKIGSGQGEREFRAEVEIISRVHHRHLVSLVGYCIAEQHRLLVYEFVPNGTLEHHLHGKGRPVMEWSKRVKIAIGSAKGLAYLHEDCHPRIIHRDIKSANILLDNSFEAQVADFGLAKLSNDTHTHVSTRVMGTFGYMAPEYASSGKLTDRSDVFSFGVVLLEIVTGRKPVDPSQPLGEESLVEWARPLLIHAIETGEFQELVDPRLENNFDRNEMSRMIETAAACVRHSAPKRPRMQQVVRALDSEGEMADLTNGVKYGQSTVFQSSQYPSTDIQKFRRMAFGGSGQFSSQEYEPSNSTPYSGEYGPHSREQWPQSSGEYPNNSDSETRAIFRRPGEGNNRNNF